MRHLKLVAAPLAAALALTVGVAAAAAPSYPTQIVFGGFVGPDANGAFTGLIDSPKNACLSGRTLKGYKQTAPSTYELFDTDKTSQNGGWALRGDLTGEPPVKFKVTKKNIGTKSHPRICDASKLVLGP